jgi:UDP-N-acetylglucosamine 2-epimerase (non-hydrolysing)
MGVKVAHVEAGIRSGDQTMPEEINRIVTDSITDYFFTTSENANQNLRQIGVKKEAIYLVGNTMIDTLLKMEPHFQKPAIWDEIGLNNGGYFVLTLHRPSNVDDFSHFEKLLNEITQNVNEHPVILPAHPRTRKVLNELELKDTNLFLIDPLNYLSFNYLVKHAMAVITDSGGITEEATVMNIPCMTLRDSTERPETVDIGTNELLGRDPGKIKPAMQKLFEGNWKKGHIPEKWDGNAAERIVEKLANVRI